MKKLPTIVKGIEIKSIIAFLEQIPLPLAIQNSAGEISYQNSCWRDRLETENYSFSQTNKGKQAKEQSKQNQKIDPPSPVYPYCLKGSTELEKKPDTLPLSSSNNLVANAVEQQLIQMASSQPKKTRKKSHLPLTPSQEYLTLSEVNPSKLEKIPTNWQCYRLPLNIFPTNLESQSWLVIAVNPTQSFPASQQQLEQTDLAYLSQIKDEFIARIGHELKSPLTAIVGLASLLQAEKLGELNQRQLQYAKSIYQNSRKSVELANNLLDLTRLATGKFTLQLEPIEIEDLCETAYQKALQKTSVKPSDEVQERLDVVVAPELRVIWADERRLQQILIYLLENAFKTAFEGVKIQIAVESCGCWIAIKVIYWGEETERQLHFEPDSFISEDKSRRSPFESQNLVPILAQQLAKIHGGELSFNQAGDRQECVLLLPAHFKTNRVAETTPTQTNQQRLVLIAEAVPYTLKYLTIQLKSWGYVVVVARTGTEAIAKARQLSPDKIILNASLPLLSGWDVLTLLKADAATSSIPIVFLGTTSDRPKAIKSTEHFIELPIIERDLEQLFPPLEINSRTETSSLTILRLYPESTDSTTTIVRDENWNMALNNHLSSLNHRVLEADSLEQAELLAQIWKLDAIVLDGSILVEPLQYLQSLSKLNLLASLPIVTLDVKTTAAANQIKELSVFPCLVSAEDRSLLDLVQVIQIAAGIMNRQEF